MIILQPPSDTPGNLGDEAILNGLYDHCYREKIKFIHDFKHPPNDDEFWNPEDELWFCAGDTLDGKYDGGPSNLNFLKKAVEKGIPAKVLGFSWSANPNEETLETIKNLKDVDYRTRDEYSNTTFTCQTGIAAEQTSDISFLMDSADRIPKYAQGDKIKEFIDPNKHTMLVNVTYFTDTAIHDKFDEFANYLNKHKDIQIILVEHDRRNWSDDRDAAYFFSRKLHHQVFRCEYLNARHIRTLCQMVDSVVTFRLHLGIAALASGTPVVAVDYNEKMPGIFKQFDLEDYVVDDYEKLPQLIERMLDELRPMEDAINDNLSYVKQLAARNFPDYA